MAINWLYRKFLQLEVIKGDSSTQTAISIIFTKHLQRNRNPISFKRQLRHYLTENNRIYWKKIVLKKNQYM